MQKIAIAGIVCLALGTLGGHYVLTLQSRIESLETIIELAHQKEKIQNDQIQELSSSLRTINNEAESKKTQAYVFGILSAMEKPDVYKEIWHAGYDRGSDVKTQIENIKIEKLETTKR